MPLRGDKCEYTAPTVSTELNRRLAEALTVAGITFLDPAATLCSRKRCLSLHMGLPLYSDRAHLSIWGSRLIIARNRALLAEAFARAHAPRAP